jgi:hypothetical protein
MIRITVPRHFHHIVRILRAAMDVLPDPAAPPVAALDESSYLVVELAGMRPAVEVGPPGLRRTRLAEAVAAEAGTSLKREPYAARCPPRHGTITPALDGLFHSTPSAMQAARACQDVRLFWQRPPGMLGALGRGARPRRS